MKQIIFNKDNNMFYKKNIQKPFVNKTLRNFIIVLILYTSGNLLLASFKNVWTITFAILFTIIFIVYAIYSSIKIDEESKKSTDKKVNQLYPDKKLSLIRVIPQKLKN
jgi:hypothetical protein